MVGLLDAHISFIASSVLLFLLPRLHLLLNKCARGTNDVAVEGMRGGALSEYR